MVFIVSLAAQWLNLDGSSSVNVVLVLDMKMRVHVLVSTRLILSLNFSGVL